MQIFINCCPIHYAMAVEKSLALAAVILEKIPLT
jgi:hypothetical protein